MGIGKIFLLLVVVGLCIGAYYYYVSMSSPTAVMSITQQPDSTQTVVVGATVTLKFTIANLSPDTVFMWTRAPPGTGTDDPRVSLPNPSPTYSFTMTADLDGARYYFLAVNDLDVVQGNEITVKLGATPKITSQPSNKTVSAGATTGASFSVTATVTVGTISYQWYVCAPGSTTFVKQISSNGRASTYTFGLSNSDVKTLTKAMSGTQLYVVVTAAGTVTSSTATLTIT
jgi:hypothetical protein